VGQLDGKVAVITGASNGMGRGIADRFASEGANVCLLAREASRLESVAAAIGDRATPVACDVGDADSVRGAFDQIASRFGKIDVLINNAAIYRPCRVEVLSDADIAQTIATNLAGPINTCRAAIPLLRAAGGGDIVNVSSESTLHPFPMLSLYAATKAGLEAFGVSLGQELQEDDIRVTTVVQGTAIGAGGGSTDWSWDPEHTSEAIETWTRLGLMNQAFGRSGGQPIDAVADVHLYIVTRPRAQKLDRVHCRTF
jgi:NAD(P)-dependent dehydrogenase (short-subunit alcohol dehydrogenase family)